ncbi:f65155e5-6c6a-44f0-8e4c-fef104daeb2a [Sclerotinia trifoliorum]|uniref:F65155e5-6c6a-44f0-8e4c-fef104daeb2a n=1 Tax=Sclerotinia trifoliorum TaxID=28548 RepID=A0A8H2W1K5_9HELO|nr:f65155e5-6c6a-44f0-8e4c-fef104daeb2a [Sclerotinia trifoliorum]
MWVLKLMYPPLRLAFLKDTHNFVEHNPIPPMKYAWLSNIRVKGVDETVEAPAQNMYCSHRKEVKVEVSRMEGDQQFQPSLKLHKDHTSWHIHGSLF